MALMRDNPIPPGRYWIDLVGSERMGNFAGGVKALNESHPGLIRILSATHHAENEARDYAESQDLTGDLVKIWEAIAGRVGETAERDWVLFEVTSPAVWDYPTMGTPTIAGKDIKSEADTVQRPEPEPDITERILSKTGGIGGTISKVVLGSVLIVTLGTVGYLVAKAAINRKAG